MSRPSTSSRRASAETWAPGCPGRVRGHDDGIRLRLSSCPHHRLPHHPPGGRAAAARRGRFVDDITLAGRWHAAFVRSPHPHALIKSVDTAAALARARRARGADPGRSRQGHGRAPHDAAFQLRHAARQGLAVRAGRRRGVLRRRAGGDGAGGRPLHRRGRRRAGRGGLRAAAVRRRRAAGRRTPPPIRRELSSNVITTYKVAVRRRRMRPSPRPRMCSSRSCGSTAARRIRSRRAALLAELRQADGGITVHASTQKAHDLQQTLTSLMDFDQSLRVVAPDIGGGFGAKLCVYSEDVAVVAAAKLLNRSIKWTEDRREYFTNAVHERDQYWSLEIAVDARGQGAGRARQAPARHRRLHDSGPEHSVQLGVDHERALHRAGAVDRRHHRHEQQDAGVVGARRRLSAGGVRDGAAARSRRARDEARPRRGAAAQSHSGEQDAVQEAAEGALRRGDGIRQRRLSGLPGRGAGRRRLGRFSEAAEPKRARTAAISASASRTA